MGDSSDARAPGAVPGGDGFTDIKPTTGDIRLVMQAIGAMGTKLDRLVLDRKDDRDEIIRKIDDSKAELKTRFDEKNADLVAKVTELKNDFKDFRKDDFKPLQTDVSNLRLKWAWMAGVGAVVGIFTGVLVDLVKSHFH